MDDSIIHEFVAEQRELLELEFEADSNEADAATNKSDARASHIVPGLEASDISIGLYGRTVVRLSSLADNEVRLPAHRFTVGDEVQIRKQNLKNSPSGVISAVADTFIDVALFPNNSYKQGNNSKNQLNKKNDAGDDEEQVDILSQPPFSLVPMSSVQVHRKMVSTLDVLDKQGTGHPIAGHIVSAMFHPDFKDGQQSQTRTEIQPFNPNLDQSQLEAISFALRHDQKIALIHGPPGTGKTTTVAELIHQAVRVHKMKVLVTAPSNVAVDNILERLVLSDTSERTVGNNKASAKGILRAIRLGHPARIKASILKYSLESQVQSADGTEIVDDVRKELQSYLRVLSKPKSKGNDKRIAYREIKTLRKEIRTREEKVVQELLSTTQVVLATTVGAANRLLDKVEGGFDLVIIDEAAQALEASCWIPILRGRKVVLAGDHCQLPPTIKARSQRAQLKLSKTMFERLMELYGDDKRDNGKSPRISRMLQVQYRMHHDIADWASQAMYGGELKTHDSVKDQTLSQLDMIKRLSSEGEPDEMAETVMLLVDTAGCEYFETVNSAGSRFNQGEAKIVTQHVHKLMQLGLDQSQVAIITPYNGQVELLRSMLLPDFPKLEIRSVDGFQGGEREAVVLSLVRSSDRGGKDGIGFLKDDRRQNVAITRAKRHLAVVCDTETVSQSKFIQNLISWMEDKGEHRSAIEYAAAGAQSEYEADLISAETELLRLVESEVEKTEKEKAKKFEAKKMAENKRKELMDSISTFAENGQKGDEMKLSSELTSYDRRLVHEFAEQLGLGHKSEGVDGVNRSITLSIQKGAVTKPLSHKTEIVERGEESLSVSTAAEAPIVSTFANLELDDSDSQGSDEDDNDAVHRDNQDKVPVDHGSEQGENSMLSQLAREREERNREKARTAAEAAQSGNKKKSTKKPKGQKLGGKKKEKEPEENFDDLDDMAFLDAQIDKAQNSHGRKVDGKGTYRTIVNGVLNSRPNPHPKPTNARANAALKSKLKEAQSARRAKPKKKK
eukprot:scaffold115_cov123-Cylindrotheca_fusiformis.AAC.5